MMLDTLALVSSNPLSPLDVSHAAQDTLARAVQTFATGEECLKALSYQEQGSSCVVLVDTTIRDISPLNLIDALRHDYPDVLSILMADDPSPDLISRAMLAGARATLSSDLAASDLSGVLRRLAHVSQAIPLASGDARTTAGSAPTARRGTIVAVIGARGGAGKSTLSAALALLAARGDLDVALVDFDLQFGDLGFLFGDSQTYTLVDLAAALAGGAQRSRGLSKPVQGGVNLYAPAPAPEQAEEVAGQARRLLAAIAAEHELVVVNTGGFWTLVHAELLDAADSALCVLDQTLVGARATKRLRELCVKLGIPPARLLYVVNRARNNRHLSVADISVLLDGVPVRSIVDGGAKLTQILDTGNFEELMGSGRGAFAEQVALVLDDVALATGLTLNSVSHMRAQMRREAKGWRKK